MFKGLPFYTPCRNLSSLVIKRWVIATTLIISGLRIHCVGLWRTWSEGKTCFLLQPLIGWIPMVFLSKPSWHVAGGGWTLLFFLSKRLCMIFFSISTARSVVRLTPSAQVCFWKEKAPFLLYFLPVTEKSGSGSMFHLLHTQICPSEVSVQSQGRLLSSFLSDWKLILEILLVMHPIHRKCHLC